MTIYEHLSVGVQDLEVAVALWGDVLGMQPMGPPQSPHNTDGTLLDPRATERLWGLPRGAIHADVILSTPGTAGGKVHLVEFTQASVPFRAGASPTDLCPKNLDVNVIDMDASVQSLVAASHQPRSAPVEFEYRGGIVREAQFPIADGFNLVLAELPDEPLITTSRGFGGITSVVTVVADIVAEVAFFEHLGFAWVEELALSGDHIEQMVGLGPGGALHLHLLGDENHRYGRAELVSYSQAAPSRDLYPDTLPPTRGLFRGAIKVDDLDGVCATLVDERHAVGEILEFPPEDVRARAFTTTSPAGWMIDVMEFRTHSSLRS